VLYLNDTVLIGHIFDGDRPPPQSLVCLCLSARAIVAFIRLLVSICASCLWGCQFCCKCQNNKI